jgi:uncharacterized protein YbjT (DUF2867 family)
MSEPVRIALFGASGLVGSTIISLCVGREDVHLSAVARRELTLPPGARMELFVAEADKWGEVLEALRPTAVICAIGTTWKKSGKDEAAFRAVDQGLVLALAREAQSHAVQRFVTISSAGADPHTDNFYLKVKGEIDRELTKMWKGRLDVLRPGLLRGKRGDDRRILERIGILVSPLVNPFLTGTRRAYRAIDAETVARAALYLAMRPARGRFVHDNDAIYRAARSLPQPLAD